MEEQHGFCSWWDGRRRWCNLGRDGFFSDFSHGSQRPLQHRPKVGIKANKIQPPFLKSSIADNMDHGDSNRSLLSERGSDVGSRYVIESGFYISSFAATIFIAGLVIVGVLLLTLLVALIVMLQSCQNQNSSVFHQWRKNYVYGYCNIFAFHKELNNLESEEFPTVCKAYVNSYINGGQYLLELNMSVQVAENYFCTVKPDNSFSVVLVDVDDILPPNITDRSKLPQYRYESEVERLAQGFVHRLYMRLQAGGWSLILFTRKPENQRNGTVDSLVATGYEGWSSLIMRSNNELSMGSLEYISRRRVELQNQGFTIVSVISSRMDALTGPSMGKRNFKLASGHWMWSHLR